MIDDKRLLSEAEAQEIAERFLLGKHFESKIEFGDGELAVKDNTQIYHLQGKLTMQSRGTLDRFVTPKTANKYQFHIEVDARKGQVLSYHLT